MTFMTGLCSLLLGGVLMAVSSTGYTMGSRPDLAQSGDMVQVKNGILSLPISMRSPEFRMGERNPVGGTAPISVKGSINTGQPVEAVFSPIRFDGGELEVTLFLRWFPKESVIRKWARYRVTGTSGTVVMREIVLENLDAGDRAVRMTGQLPQSYPAFMDGFFLGMEYPISSTRMEGNRLLLAHKPGVRMQAGIWYETRQAVYGIAKKGDEKQSFERYINAHRPPPTGFHTNYNSWWTSPVPYVEADITGLMKTFEENLYRPYGVSIDTFCIDLGWSDPNDVWKIDAERFPEGFKRIQTAAERMHSHPGLWISPCAGYAPAVDLEKAEKEGYEVFHIKSGNDDRRYACLGGKRYRERFQECLVDAVTRYGVRHVKLDGYVQECYSDGHGHEPGEFSSEAVAEGFIAALQATRKASPDVWFEATCFWNPSPWWLFYVNSVPTALGDDSPFGRVPCPTYRESYTTARDYYNLQAAVLWSAPISAQEGLGIIQQSDEDFVNDAVVTVMRGYSFLPLYVNPRYMAGPRWESLARILKWARRSASMLKQTKAILPRTWAKGGCPDLSHDGVMPREAYGYIHWKGNKGMSVFRNPWIARQTLPLALDGLPEGLEEVSIVSIYPERRVYGRNLRSGATVNIPLAPYETVLLSIQRSQPSKSIPEVSRSIGARITDEELHRSIARVQWDEAADRMGPDWTTLVDDAGSSVQVQADYRLAVNAPDAELLVLLEDKQPVTEPFCRVRINGKDADTTTSGSETGWAASSVAKREHWLFFRTPMPEGDSTVSLQLVTGLGAPRASVWVWARKPGRRPSTGSGLPEPEMISLDSLELMAPVVLDPSALPLLRQARPVERIDGVFLDALEPDSVSQGWGVLERNQSVWQRPMVINGRRFLRGLGTHAPGRIVYALGGKYRRFEAWVGADGNTSPTVTFEVRVDGRKRFESGLMTREIPAKRVDLDVTGAKTLELVLGDGDNGNGGDHGDWADARLIR